MSFFSLLRAHDVAADGDYEVLRCHVNVWSLPGLLGHRPMLFDVGLMFKAEAGLKAIAMVVPAPVARIINLSGELKDSSVGHLIFGRTFDVARPHTSQIVLNDLGAVTIVSVGETKLERGFHDKYLTEVRVPVFNLPAPGTTCYARMRFTVDSGGVMWRWQRVLGRRNGALIDFRVPDPREGGQDAIRGELEGRTKEIPELNAFFMLPERFQLRASNPELKYTRTLEGERWRPYLRRRVGGLVSRERVMVHRWAQDHVGEQSPFRGFMQLNREPGFSAVSDLALLCLLLAAVAYAAFRPLTLRSGPRDTANWIGARVGDIADRLVAALVAGGAIALVVGVVTVAMRARKMPGAYIASKRALKKIEFWWMSRFGR